MPLRFLAVLVPLAMGVSLLVWWVLSQIEKPAKHQAVRSKERRLIAEIEKQATAADNSTGDVIARMISEARQRGELEA